MRTAASGRHEKGALPRRRLASRSRKTHRLIQTPHIPAHCLAGALRPDKDADAIAGSVNLVTKKAPEQRLLCSMPAAPTTT